MTSCRGRGRGRVPSKSWDTGPPIPGPGVAKLVQTNTVAAEQPVESQFADAQQETAQTDINVGECIIIHFLDEELV